MSRPRANKAKCITIKKLFENNRFDVPDYQRYYSWNKKQRLDLFDDIDNAIDCGDTIYLSTVVALYIDEDNYDGKLVKHYSIVDGQQRITTIALLLKSISQKMSVMKPGSLEIQEIEDLLVKKTASKADAVLFQSNNPSSDNTFDDYIKDGKIPASPIMDSVAKRILNAILECDEYIKNKSISELIEIKNKVLNDFQLVFFEMAKEKDVYRAFKSLNGRGLPVSALDNIKSQLLGIAHEKRDSQSISTIKNIWADIYALIGSVKLRDENEILSIAGTLYKRDDDVQSKPKSVEDAMSDFYKIATKKYEKEELAKRFKDALKTDTEGKRCIEISNSIRDVTEQLVEISKNKRQDAITDIKQARILLVAIRLSEYKDDEKKDLLREWEKTTFRLFCLHRKDARSFLGEYLNCAIRVIDGTAGAKELCNDIQVIGSKFSFVDGINYVKGSDWYGSYNKDIIYVLQRWEEELTKKPLSATVWDKIWEEDPSKTIEHIFPKNYPSSKSGREEFHINWEHGGKQWNQEKLDKFVNRIGNMTLLPAGMNSQLGQKSYLEKVKKYDETGFKIHPTKDSAYLKKGYWTENSIKEREEDIVEFIKKTWG